MASATYAVIALAASQTILSALAGPVQHVAPEQQLRTDASTSEIHAESDQSGMPTRSSVPDLAAYFSLESFRDGKMSQNVAAIMKRHLLAPQYYIPERVRNIPNMLLSQQTEHVSQKELPSGFGVATVATTKCGTKLVPTEPYWPDNSYYVEWECEQSYPWFYIISSAVVSCLFGLWYKYGGLKQQGPWDVPVERVTLRRDGEFRHGLFDCFDLPCLCLLSMCCPSVRWSDTVSMTGFMSFALAMVVWIGLVTSSYFGAPGWLILMLIAAVHRQNLRKKVGLPHGDCGSWSSDCCIWCWCSVCAIVQEAREVEAMPQLKQSENV